MKRVGKVLCYWENNFDLVDPMKTQGPGSHVDKQYRALKGSDTPLPQEEVPVSNQQDF